LLNRPRQRRQRTLHACREIEPALRSRSARLKRPSCAAFSRRFSAISSTRPFFSTKKALPERIRPSMT